MGLFDRFAKVSQSPTKPPEPAASGAADAPAEARPFDVADLYGGPVASGEAAPTVAPGASLDEKLRQAYFWITNHGIISPFYDIEYAGPSSRTFRFGDAKVPVTLPSEQSYSSYVLLPLLNLAVKRRCLLVGGPGRGKTVIAVLMGVLAGYPLAEIQRTIQHGQPQMTVADLLGNPLPSSLVSAASLDAVKIGWRRWLSMRVRIIDEYNRIPTRTQSALLTVMADGYAEVYDQVYECPDAAWYLTANDDAGGGTYQVIEALRDRIDVVVKALHFNTRFLSELLDRIEGGFRPEEVVPPEIVFTPGELDRMDKAIRAVRLPDPLLRRIEHFASWFEFLEPAARQVEYMTKDTVKLAAIDLAEVAARDAGKDAALDLGRQTQNGLSVRALMTILSFVKAMAWFRGAPEVSFEDVRQMLPFVLHDKLVQNPDAPFFEQAGNAALRSDRIAWIRGLFDASCREFDRLDLDRDDPVRALARQLDEGLEGVSEAEVRRRLAAVEKTLGALADGRKMYGPLFDDVLQLKYLHQRYSNYLRWLTWAR